MSDTPETDTYAKADWWTLFRATEHGRILERERDEAREALKHIGEYGTEEINAAIDLRQKLASALVERDEAIRQRNETNESSAFSCNFYYEEKLKAERERNEWAAMCGRYKQERDEALMDRTNGNIATMTINHYERILRERDEARESLRILAGLVAYGLGQSGEEWSLEAMRQATTAIQNAKSLEDAK
jgi:hypothetical protein